MLRNFVRAGLALAVMLALVPHRGTASASSPQVLSQAPFQAPQALSLKLGNLVFNDLNNNGLREADEIGVPDVWARLLTSDTDGSTVVVGYTRTDAYGKYLFSALVPGDYSVEIVLPPAYQSSHDAATSGTPDNGVDDDDNGVLLLGSVVRSNAVRVGADDLPEANLSLDFGIWQPASMGDWAWQDNDNDGLQTEGEVGLPDTEVTLYDLNGSPITTTRTDADGRYTFEGLTPSSYAVGLVLPAGYEFSPRGRGDENTDSDVDPLTGRTALVKLQPGENNMRLDVGLFPVALQVSIALTSQPAPSRPNDPASVRPSDAVTYTIAITNIGNSPVTHVTVTNSVPNGAAYMAGSASPNLDASSTISLLIWETPVLSATQRMTMSFAVRVDDSRSNTLTKLRNEAVVRSDQTPPNTSNRTSHDVVPQTAAGPALSIIVMPDAQTITVGSTAVFTVEVTNTGGFDLYGTEVHPTLATDCDHFIGALAVGESVRYTCKQASVMAAFTDTLTTLSFAGRGSLVLSSYTTMVNLKPTARLGDYVWLDEAGDGIQRSNAGMAGVQVRLVSQSISVTQTTNAQGFYGFDDVPPGRYRVCVVPPAGHSFTRQGRNPGSGVDSDVDPATGCTRPITATASVMDTSIDVGLVPVVMQLVQTALPKPNNEDNRLHVNIGDRLTYTLSLHNAGLQPARNVVITDALPIDVQVISGTAQPTATWAAGQLGWALAELGSGERYTMSFAVRVVSQISVSIQNRAFVETTQTPMVASNEVVHVFSPTAVQLLSFAGVWQMGERPGVELAWQTGAEVNSFGFALYRSETSERNDRVRVTSEWIAAKNSRGATYVFMDESAMPGRRYTYWLVEIERDGDVIEYDPIAVKPMNAAVADVPAGGAPLAAPVGAAPVAAPHVALSAGISNAPSQAVVPVQAEPASTQRVASAQIAIEPRSELQPLAPTAQPSITLANVVPTPAPVAQPTQQATARPINISNTPNPKSVPTLTHLRSAEVISETRSQSISSTSSTSSTSSIPHASLLSVVLALAGLLLMVSLASVLLLLRVSIRADLS